MRNHLLYLLVCVLFILGCKKTPLPSEEISDPVFKLDAKLDGMPLKFEAGNDEYYMYSSFEQDKNNLYVFKGELQKTCAPGCGGYALTILINDYKISSLNGNINIDSAVHTGPYFLNDKTFYPTTQQLSFVPAVSYAEHSLYKWKFYDADNNITSAESYSLTQTFEIGKTYSVALEYLDGTGGCQNTHTNVFRVGNSFQASVTASSGSDAFQYHFYAHANTAGNYQYLWEFGDGSSSTVASPNHIYGSLGSYTAKLTMVNGTDTAIVYHQISTTNAGCVANYTTRFIPVNFTKIYRSITVLLTDPQGVVYSSADVTQPMLSHIEINSVEDYIENNKGLKTKKVDLIFDCLLKGGSKVISLNQAHAVIAIAYK